MLDRRQIRDNPDAVKTAVRVKGIDLDVDELISLDKATRALQTELDQAQARRKSSAKEFAKAGLCKSPSTSRVLASEYFASVTPRFPATKVLPSFVALLVT